MNIRKLFALSLTSLVIGILIVSGPVQSFSLGLDIDKVKVTQGKTITFTAEINIGSGETIPLEELTLLLEGPEKISCQFTPNGEIISGCEGITITKIGSSQNGYGYYYGYGYGYTDGKLAYSIKLNTLNYKTGVYQTKLEVKINDETFTQQGEPITIKYSSSNSGGSFCALEWVCDPWSPCVDGQQFRTCYRNLNYCEPQDKPAETRTCLVSSYEENNNVKVLLNNQDGNNLPQESRTSLVSPFNSDKGGQFLIILLLMNCIITLLNIIVRVNKTQKIQRRI